MECLVCCQFDIDASTTSTSIDRAASNTPHSTSIFAWPAFPNRQIRNDIHSDSNFNFDIDSIENPQPGFSELAYASIDYCRYRSGPDPTFSWCCVAHCVCSSLALQSAKTTAGHSNGCRLPLNLNLGRAARGRRLRQRPPPPSISKPTPEQPETPSECRIRPLGATTRGDGSGDGEGNLNGFVHARLGVWQPLPSSIPARPI